MRADRSYARPSDVVPWQDAEQDDCAVVVVAVNKTATAAAINLFTATTSGAWDIIGYSG